jgi:hypothetical protein
MIAAFFGHRAQEELDAQMFLESGHLFLTRDDRASRGTEVALRR